MLKMHTSFYWSWQPSPLYKFLQAVSKPTSLCTKRLLHNYDIVIIKKKKSKSKFLPINAINTFLETFFLFFKLGNKEIIPLTPMFLSLHCYISVTALSAKKSDHQYVCHFPVDNNCSCWLSEQTTLSLCCSGLLGHHEVGHAVADHVEPGPAQDTEVLLFGLLLVLVWVTPFRHSPIPHTLYHTAGLLTHCIRFAGVISLLARVISLFAGVISLLAGVVSLLAVMIVLLALLAGCIVFLVLAPTMLFARIISVWGGFLHGIRFLLLPPLAGAEQESYRLSRRLALLKQICTDRDDVLVICFNLCFYKDKHHRSAGEK